MTPPPRPASRFAHAAEWMGHAKTLTSAVVAVIVAVFIGGIAWAKVATREDLGELEERVAATEKKQAAVDAVLPLILETVTRIDARLDALSKEIR